MQPRPLSLCSRGPCFASLRSARKSLALTLERVSKELACQRWPHPTPSSMVCNPRSHSQSPTAASAARQPPVAVRSAEIGKAFVTHYYQMFDASIEQRSTLQAMYQDASMLTFENEQFMGMQAIMTKLTVRLAWG